MLKPKCESCFLGEQNVSQNARAGHLYSLQLHGFFLTVKYFILNNIPMDSALLRNPHLHLPFAKTRFISHADKHINPGSRKTHQYPRKGPRMKDLTSPANALVSRMDPRPVLEVALLQSCLQVTVVSGRAQPALGSPNTSPCTPT